MINLRIGYTRLREFVVDAISVNLVPYITGSPGV